MHDTTDGADTLSLRALEESLEKGKILEAVVTLCDAEHNLIVDLGKIRGIIPRNEGAVGIAEGSVRDIALISRVGKSVAFIVTDIVTENGKVTATLSRRAAQEKCGKEYIEKLSVGDIINVKIKSVDLNKKRIGLTMKL